MFYTETYGIITQSTHYDKDIRQPSISKFRVRVFCGRKLKMCGMNFYFPINTVRKKKKLSSYFMMLFCLGNTPLQNIKVILSRFITFFLFFRFLFSVLFCSCVCVTRPSSRTVVVVVEKF